MTCGFRVWAPNAGSVHVTGPSCEWREREQPLAKQGGGSGATTARRVGAGEPYRFVIQNGSQHWRVDAYARDVAQDGDGSSPYTWARSPR
jgi:1,4-alpha-glucan branching enzyme